MFLDIRLEVRLGEDWLFLGLNAIMETSILSILTTS